MTPRRLILGALTLLLGLLPLSLRAQEGAVQRQPYLDLRRYYLGFRFGLHATDLRLTNSGRTDSDGGQLWADTPEYHPSFSVGLVGGWVLVPNLELRLMPTLHIGDAPVAYTDGSQRIQEMNVRTNYLQLPLEVKWGAMRWGNYRPYLSAGPYASLSFSGKDKLLRLQPLDYGLSIGAGCDIYFSFFKLSPQLSFHYGLANVLDADRPDLQGDRRIRFTETLQSASTRMILLSLSFE